jgi:hypothetical protein
MAINSVGFHHLPSKLLSRMSVVSDDYIHFFLNIFVANAFIYLSTRKHIINIKLLLCFPKSLIPWQDLNPGLYVHIVNGQSLSDKNLSENFLAEMESHKIDFWRKGMNKCTIWAACSLSPISNYVMGTLGPRKPF